MPRLERSKKHKHRRRAFESLEPRYLLSGTESFTNSTPVAPLSTTAAPAGMSNVSASDFTYLGKETLLNGNWFSGLAYRPETNTFFTIDHAGKSPFDLIEFSNPGVGGTARLVKDWGNLNVNNVLQTSGIMLQMEGLWWDDSTQRLWISYGSYYNSNGANQQVLANVTLITGVPVVHGPWGVVASVGSEQVKSEITPAPAQLAAITGNPWLMFGGSTNTAQRSSWGAGLVSVADPSALPAGSLTAAEELVNWPMEFNTYNDISNNSTFNDYYSGFPSGTTSTLIQYNPNVNLTTNFSYQYNALVNNGTHFVMGDGLSNYAWVDTGAIQGFVYFGRMAAGYSWYGNANSHEDSSLSGLSFQNDLTSLINLGRPLVDTVARLRGNHADQWQYDAYFLNYQDVLNAATAVKAGTATASTLEVAPSSINSLNTLGGAPPIAGATSLGGSYFDPRTDDLYLVMPNLFELLVWHIGAPTATSTGTTAAIGAAILTVNVASTSGPTVDIAAAPLSEAPTIAAPATSASAALAADTFFTELGSV